KIIVHSIIAQSAGDDLQCTRIESNCIGLVISIIADGFGEYAIKIKSIIQAAIGVIACKGKRISKPIKAISCSHNLAVGLYGNRIISTSNIFISNNNDLSI